MNFLFYNDRDIAQTTCRFENSYYISKLFTYISVPNFEAKDCAILAWSDPPIGWLGRFELWVDPDPTAGVEASFGGLGAVTPRVFCSLHILHHFIEGYKRSSPTSSGAILNHRYIFAKWKSVEVGATLAKLCQHRGQMVLSLSKYRYLNESLYDAVPRIHKPCDSNKYANCPIKQWIHPYLSNSLVFTNCKMHLFILS